MPRSRPILPLWLTALVVLRERVPRHFATVAVAAAAAGGAANLWLLSRFAAGIWAG